MVNKKTLSEKIKDMRRQVRVCVPVWGLQQLITQGNESHVRVIEGIPPTSEFVREYYDVESGNVILVFRDDSFEVVPEGERVPMFFHRIEVRAVPKEQV